MLFVELNELGKLFVRLWIVLKVGLVKCWIISPQGTQPLIGKLLITFGNGIVWFVIVDAVWFVIVDAVLFIIDKYSV